jgi:hypothetical protein
VATLNRSVITLYLNCNTATSRQCTYKRNIESPLHDHFCRGKAISYKNYESVCILAFVIRHANRIFLHSTISSYVVRLSLSKFSTLSHIRNEFRKNFIEHKMSVLIFYAANVEKFLILRKTLVRYYHNVHRCLCKVPIILVRY